MQHVLPEGYSVGGYCAGLKKWEKEDVGIILSETPATTAGIFTVNKFQAAPVYICKEHIDNNICAVLANSGCANACTGTEGYENAFSTLRQAARRFAVQSSQILPASTGVIGKQLEVTKINRAIEKVETGFIEKHLQAFARSIMTTDTFPKIVSRQLSLKKGPATITAFSKGAGMIAPNMATMLVFILTDVDIKKSLLHQMLSQAADSTYHSISVDGDMSTNDSVFCLANGRAGSIKGKEDYFYEQLKGVMEESARLIVKDGEGATKLITVEVKSAPSKEVAHGIAMKVARSNLVKTAFFGEDANWGRIISAAGSYEGDFDPRPMEVYIGPHLLFKNLVPLDFDEEKVTRTLQEDEITVCIDLNQGEAGARAWTCDFSYEYVRINADYRT